MKKITLILAAAIVSAASLAQAQNELIDARESVSFGAKAGINYSNVYDEQGEDFEADGKVGFAGGAFVAIPLGTFLGLQPEALISQKGLQATGSFLGDSYSFTRTTTYLDIPILLAVKPAPFLSIVAGPQFSYLLKQKDVFASPFGSVEMEQEFENDDIRRNTLCLTGGLDFNLNHVVLSTRAGWDMMNNNGDGTSSTPRYKNVWLQATAGFRLYN